MGLDVVDGVGLRHVQRDSMIAQCLNDDMHGGSNTRRRLGRTAAVRLLSCGVAVAVLLMQMRMMIAKTVTMARRDAGADDNDDDNDIYDNDNDDTSRWWHTQLIIVQKHTYIVKPPLGYNSNNTNKLQYINIINQLYVQLKLTYPYRNECLNNANSTYDYKPQTHETQ